MPSVPIPSVTRTVPFRSNPYSSASHTHCCGFELGPGAEGGCFALHQAQDLRLFHLRVLHPVLKLSVSQPCPSQPTVLAFLRCLLHRP